MRQDNSREAILERGVANLQEYGYPSCNTENILTDQIFSAFFLAMLDENIDNPRVPEGVKATLRQLKQDVLAHRQPVITARKRTRKPVEHAS